MAAPQAAEQLVACPLHVQSLCQPRTNRSPASVHQEHMAVASANRAASTASPESPGAGGKPTLMKRKAGSQCPRNFDRAEILLQLAVHILRGRLPKSKNSLQLRKWLKLGWQLL